MCFLWASNGSYWYPFRNRSTQTRAQAQQTSPRGSNISLFKTSLREEPWNTTHQQPRRVLQEALHVATSGKSWLGSREKIFYLEDSRGASAWNLSSILLRIGAHRVGRTVRKIFRFNSGAPRYRTVIRFAIPNAIIYLIQLFCPRKTRVKFVRVGINDGYIVICHVTVDEKHVALFTSGTRLVLQIKIQQLSEIIATFARMNLVFLDYRSDSLAKEFAGGHSKFSPGSGSPHESQFARAFSLRVPPRHFIYRADIRPAHAPSALLSARVRTWIRISWKTGVAAPDAS